MMALDPSIILGIQMPKLPTQADIAESQAKIQESRARVEQIKFARQKAIDDAANRAAVNAAVQSNIGPDGIPNFKAAIASLHQSGRTDAAMTLDQAWQKQREAAAQAEDAELKNHNDHAEAVASLLNGATPENYATRLSYIRAVDPEGAKQLGETYDPQKVEAVKAATIKTVEYNREQAAATKQALSGDVENAIARIMPTVSDAEWANLRLKFIAFGADPSEIPETPSPEARARVAQLGISAEKRVELEAQAEARRAAADERAIDNARADKQLGISAAHLRLAQATEARQARESAQRAAAPGAGTDMPSEYQTALARVTLTTPATRRGPIIATVNRLWKEGKVDDLKEVIRQLAVEGENVDVKNQVMGRRTTVASLNDAKALLKEMKDAGVPTNFLRGSAENVARALGETTNPKYVEFGTRLKATLINYRRSVTGVQFSERESAEYEKMFPNYKQTFPVNEATISGLLREMSTQDKTYWENKLGKSGAELVGALPKTGEIPAGAKVEIWTKDPKTGKYVKGGG